MKSLYIEISGHNYPGGYWPQRCTIREVPDAYLRDDCQDFAVCGFKSFHLVSDRDFDDDPEILTVTLNFPYDQYAEFLTEGKGIGTVFEQYPDDPQFVVLTAMLHKLAKLTGAEFVCCGQY